MRYTARQNRFLIHTALLASALSGIPVASGQTAQPTQETRPPDTLTERSIKGPRIAHPTFASGEFWMEWLDNDRILAMAPNERAPILNLDSLPDRPSGNPGYYSIFSVRFSAGAVDRMPAFAKVMEPYLVGRGLGVSYQDEEFNEKGRETRYQHPPASLSPDGKTLLFWNRRESTWVASDLAALRIRAFPGDEEKQSRGVWHPEGGRWFQPGYQMNETLRLQEINRLLVRSLDSPGRITEVKVRPKARGYALGFLPDGNLLTFEPWYDLQYDYGTTSFWVVRLDGKDKDGRPLTDSATAGYDAYNLGIRVPLVDGLPSVVEEVTLSRQGDRLCFLISSHRRDKQSAARIPEMLSLWVVSTSHWTPLREVARIRPQYRSFKTREEALANPMGYKENLPRYVRWLPDGKRVSYLINGTVHVLPVD
jgi:hypothetical protein